MTHDLNEPRRFKMPSELDDDERAASGRIGADARRVERDQYVRWRRDTLAGERDDLPLRMRLLEEEAEAIRSHAAVRQTDALDGLTAADWIERDKAKGEGKEVGPLDDGGAAGLEADADELDREAQEIRQFIAETSEAA